LADRQRRSARLDLNGLSARSAGSVRANKISLDSSLNGAGLTGLDLVGRLDLTGELRFDERSDQPWKLAGGQSFTGTRSAQRFSDTEEQRLVEDIARESRATDSLHLEISAAQATTASAAAFATLLLWTIRAGGIVAAIATSAPAWSNIDPLPLLLDETDGTVDEPDWGDTQNDTLAAVAGSTMMEAQVVLDRA
jgi:hypothetical protein